MSESRDLTTNQEQANQPTHDEATREKMDVARNSVGAAFFLTLSKATIGWMTGSLGILSEALHSGLDLLATLVTWMAVSYSGRPADEKHPYGHGKIESISALIEVGLLMLTCYWIILEAIERLTGAHKPVTVTFLAFAVMGVSMAIDFWRARLLYAAAQKHNSQALAADALHFSSDILSSFVVIVGLAFAAMGYPKADPIAALGVVAMVTYASWGLSVHALDTLLDRAPAGMLDKIRTTARSIPGVVTVTNARARSTGSAGYFVDLTIMLAPDLAFEAAHGVSHQVESAVRDAVGTGSIVQVHFEPGSHLPTDLLTAIRRISLCQRGVIGLHNVDLHQDHDSLLVALHLEVNATLTLADAHLISSQLEAAIRDLDQRIKRVMTHLEPAEARPAAAFDGTDTYAKLGERVFAMVSTVNGLAEPHNLHFVEHDGELHLELHVRAEGTLPIGEAHRLSTTLERNIRAALPELARVTIHTEPLRSR